MMKHTCEKRVYGSSMFVGPGHLHGVSAKYEHEGKWYCKTHHPPTVKAKANEESCKWRAERNAEDAARAKGAAIRKAEQRVLKVAMETAESSEELELDRACHALKALGWKES